LAVITSSAIVVPIDLSTLFEKTDTRLPGNGKPYLYTRLGNPTRSALETQLASIFLTEHAVTANNIQSAYYALGLLIRNEVDEICLISSSKESIVGDLVRQVYGEGPQSFKISQVADIA
jgi:cystathionine beta-lyase/cystathionine gamma-synthase